MVGQLNENQINDVLNSQLIGRIGIAEKGQSYIVPVSYVYKDGYIYAHSKDGLKLRMMRSNPNVCFQVDVIDNMRNWRSVIVQGKYEELSSPRSQTEALKIMNDRFGPFSISDTVLPAKNLSTTPLSLKNRLKAVAYRIKVKEKTGMYEKN